MKKKRICPKCRSARIRINHYNKSGDEVFHCVVCDQRFTDKAYTPYRGTRYPIPFVNEILSVLKKDPDISNTEIIRRYGITNETVRKWKRLGPLTGYKVGPVLSVPAEHSERSGGLSNTPLPVNL